ncbi:MAG: Lsr2 family protein [Propionibacteriaceae bacterium]|nr:Lsr2 family protein [Propionibacteriaceae bacterium]
MTKRVKTILIDDIDGSNADETVTFNLDGVTYEIDLNGEHAAQLRDGFTWWIGHGRRVSGRRPRGARPAGVQLSEIRAWAAANGYQVSDRGRISAEIRAAYDQAHA